MHDDSSLGRTVHGDVGGLPVSTAMLHVARMAVDSGLEAKGFGVEVIGNTVLVIDHFIIDG